MLDYMCRVCWNDSTSGFVVVTLLSLISRTLQVSPPHQSASLRLTGYLQGFMTLDFKHSIESERYRQYFEVHIYAKK